MSLRPVNHLVSHRDFPKGWDRHCSKAWDF